MLKRVIKHTRKTVIMCGAALLLFGAVKQPSMVSYAAETQATQQTQQIVSYGQAQVKALGSWEQQSDSRWKFKQFTGSYLTSSWIESQSELGAWYFVDSNGYMLTSTTTPDGYYVDANGIWKATGGNSNGSNGGSGQQSGQTQQVTQNNGGSSQTGNGTSNQDSNNGSGQQDNGNNGGSGNWWDDIAGEIGNGRLNNSPSLNQ